jgi:hypothetical protein
MKCQAVDSMNYCRLALCPFALQCVTGIPAEDSRLGRMGVDDVRLQLPQKFFYLEVTDNIVVRINGPAHPVNNNHFIILAFRLFEQLTLGSDCRTGDECNIMSPLCQELTGNQRILLRSP